MSYKRINSGIYCIENMINNKKYIGKSTSIEERFVDHKRELNKNKHGNVYLQRSWNKYGEQCFKFYILELCSVDKLNEREQYWISFYNTFIGDGYNETIGGDGKRSSGNIPVYQYSIDGVFLNQYKSAYDAVLNQNNWMAGHIIECCKGSRKSAYGYLWSYKKELSIESLKYDYCDSKPVYQYDVNGDYVMEYKSSKEAAKCVGLKNNSPIVACCVGRNKYSAGYQWSYIKCDNIGTSVEIKNSHNAKTVYQYSVDLEFIASYESVREAGRCVSNSAGGYSPIYKNIYNKAKTAYGYIWSYLSPEEFLKNS